MGPWELLLFIVAVLVVLAVLTVVVVGVIQAIRPRSRIDEVFGPAIARRGPALPGLEHLAEAVLDDRVHIEVQWERYGDPPTGYRVIVYPKKEEV